MRWPTARKRWSLKRASMKPSTSANRWSLSASDASLRFSNRYSPAGLFTTSRGLASCSSSRPWQSRTGSAAEISNRPNLMLDEPALRTRTASDAGMTSTRLARPRPVADLRHVVAVLAYVARMLDQCIAELLLHMRGFGRKPWHALDRLDREVVAVELVEHDHVERRRRGAFFDEAADMQAGMVGAVISQAMDQGGIAVIGENHGLVAREQAVEVAMADPMRMLLLRLQRHEVNDIHDADLQIRQRFAQQIDGREGLQRRHVAGAGHHDVGLAARVLRARPGPDADAGIAMRGGIFHRKPLRRRLLAGDDHVDTVIGALAEMFAQDFHHAAVLREMHIVRFGRLHPDAFGRLEHGIEPV